MSDSTARLTEIKARLAKAAPQQEYAKDYLNLSVTHASDKDRGAVVILYGDNDYCAEVYDNLGAVDGPALAEVFAHAPADLAFLLDEVRRLRACLALIGKEYEDDPDTASGLKAVARAALADPTGEVESHA